MENKINKDKLEDALNKKENLSKDLGMSKEMEIGFHQGSINTLINERNELIKMIANVEGVMQAHMKRLEELGIKIKTSENK